MGCVATPGFAPLHRARALRAEVAGELVHVWPADLVSGDAAKRGIVVGRVGGGFTLREEGAPFGAWLLRSGEGSAVVVEDG